MLPIFIPYVVHRWIGLILPVFFLRDPFVRRMPLLPFLPTQLGLNVCAGFLCFILSWCPFYLCCYSRSFFETCYCYAILFPFLRFSLLALSSTISLFLAPSLPSGDAMHVLSCARFLSIPFFIAPSLSSYDTIGHVLIVPMTCTVVDPCILALLRPLHGRGCGRLVPWSITRVAGPVGILGGSFGLMW